jgi:excisionase family DNA binding protein
MAAAELQDRLLTIESASEYLALSPRSTRRLIQAGMLEKIQLRGAVRVRLSDVARLIGTDAGEAVA